MSETNKALVRRWIEEGFNLHNPRLTGELLAADHVFHEASTGAVCGLEAITKGFLVDWCAAFPDLHCVVESQVAEGDRVVTQWRWTGTHSGPFLGIASTGRSVNVESVLICRISQDRIAETWEVWDARGFFRQLGVVSRKTELNKQAVRRYVEEVWNQGNLGLVDDLFAPESGFFAPHFANLVGVNSRKRLILQLRRAFPDVRFAVEDIIAEGDSVVLRWSCVGTHLGEWAGAPATGRVIPSHGASTFRFRKGLITEELVQWDALSVMRDLGVLATPAKAAAAIA
jgi:steroid delta-isomerase-like uncharacterized protein